MNINKQYFLVKLLNNLLKKGYTLNESLILIKNVSNKIVDKIIEMLDEGLPLSLVLHKLKFKSFVYQTIKIGEESNKVNEAVNLIVYYFEFHLKIKNQINKVLLYPAILFCFSLISFEFIRIKLYPIIHLLLSDFNVMENNILIFLSFNLLKIIALLIIIFLIVIIVYRPITNIIPSVKIYRSLYISNNITLLLSCGSSLEEILILLNHNLNAKVYQIEKLTNIIFNQESNSLVSPYTLPFINFIKLGINAKDILKILNDFNSIYFNILFDRLEKRFYYLQFFLFIILSTNIFLIYYAILSPTLNLTNNL